MQRLRAAGSREVDACAAEAMHAAATHIAHIERRASRRGRELELPRRAGIAHVVRYAGLQHAQRLAHEVVLHTPAIRRLVRRQCERRAAQGGGDVRFARQRVSGEGHRVAGHIQDRQRPVVVSSAGDDDLLAGGKAVVGPTAAVVAHDGVRVGGVAHPRERHVGERCVARQQLDLVGAVGERVVGRAITQAADRGAVRDVGDLVAGGVARATDVVAVGIEASEIDAVVVDRRERRVAGDDVGVGFPATVRVDLNAVEGGRRRRDVAHGLAVGEAGEVDEAVGRDHIRRGHGIERNGRSDGGGLGGEQLDREVVERAHVVGAGAQADAGGAAGVVKHRVAVDEVMRRREADHVARAVDAHAGGEHRPGVGGTGPERRAELQVVAIDDDDTVVAVALQRATRCLQRWLAVPVVGDHVTGAQAVRGEADRVSRRVHVGERLEGVAERAADEVGLGQDVGQHVDVTARGHGRAAVDEAAHRGGDVAVVRDRADGHAADGCAAGRQVGRSAMRLGVDLDVAARRHHACGADRGRHLGSQIGIRVRPDAGPQAARPQHDLDIAFAGADRDELDITGGVDHGAAHRGRYGMGVGDLGVGLGGRDQADDHARLAGGRRGGGARVEQQGSSVQDRSVAHRGTRGAGDARVNTEDADRHPGDDDAGGGGSAAVDAAGARLHGRSRVGDAGGATKSGLDHRAGRHARNRLDGHDTHKGDGDTERLGAAGVLAGGAERHRTGVADRAVHGGLCSGTHRGGERRNADTNQPPRTYVGLGVRRVGGGGVDAQTARGGHAAPGANLRQHSSIRRDLGNRARDAHSDRADVHRKIYGFGGVRARGGDRHGGGREHLAAQ